MQTAGRKAIRSDEAEQVYGDVVKWVTIAAAAIAMIAPVLMLAMPGRNLVSPNRVFAMVFAGAGKEAIWGLAEGGFPGGHFYLRRWMTADGLAQFGIALGCGTALFGLLPACAILFVRRERMYGLICLLICLLIVLAMSETIRVSGG